MLNVKLVLKIKELGLKKMQSGDLLGLYLLCFLTCDSLTIGSHG